MKNGDIVRVNNSFNVIIKGIKVYRSFKKMINAEGLKNVLPTEYKKGSSIDEAIDNVYRKFYPEHKEKKYGVIAIYLSAC